MKTSPAGRWTAAALGPVWYMVYGAFLVVPSPAPLVRSVAPIAPLFPLVGVGLGLIWGTAVVVLSCSVAWAGILRLKTRRWAPLVAPLSLRPRSAIAILLVAWLSPFAAQPLWELRRRGIEACIADAQSIVDALDHYHRENGEYPSSLHKLVPRYLSSVPTPASLAYSEFQYRRADGDSKYAGYELALLMPHGGSGDRLIHWPSERYPDTIYSGEVDRIRGWAYVRE